MTVDANVLYTETGIKFALSEVEGEPCRCLAVAVLDLISGEPVWFFIADPDRVGSLDKLLAYRTAKQLAGGAELAQLAELGRSTRGLPLTEITYGSVPAGFVQIEPERRQAIELVPDRHYALLIVGAETILVEFEAKTK